MTANSELIQHNAELTALLHLSQTALLGLPLQSVVDCALEHVMTIIAPDQVFVYHATDNALILMGACPTQHYPLPEKEKIGQCLCGLAASLGKPIFSPDIHHDGRCTLNECKKAGVHSIASLPLTVDGELLGVMSLASMRNRDFAAEQGRLERLASATALAIKRTMTFAALEQKIQDLTCQIDDRSTELIIRSKELERLNRLFVTREFRIKSLRELVKTLKGQQ